MTDSLTDTEAEAMRQVMTRGVKNNPLPPKYEAAIAALTRCSKNLTFRNYRAAQAALAAAADDDECASWPKANALASYGRQSDDKRLERLARKIELQVAAAFAFVEEFAKELDEKEQCGAIAPHVGDE